MRRGWPRLLPLTFSGRLRRFQLGDAQGKVHFLPVLFSRAATRAASSLISIALRWASNNPTINEPSSGDISPSATCRLIAAIASGSLRPWSRGADRIGGVRPCAVARRGPRSPWPPQHRRPSPCQSWRGRWPPLVLRQGLQAQSVSWNVNLEACRQDCRIVPAETVRRSAHRLPSTTLASGRL